MTIHDRSPWVKKSLKKKAFLQSLRDYHAAGDDIEALRSVAQMVGNIHVADELDELRFHRNKRVKYPFRLEAALKEYLIERIRYDYGDKVADPITLALRGMI